MFEIVSVPLNVINPNPYQPPHRLTPAKDVVARLAESIRNSGLKQTPTGRRLAGTDCVEIADGWLRFCAFRQLSAGDMNFMEMPVELHEYTDREMLDTVMEANTVRKDLTVIDLANIYKRYTEQFKVSQDELARMHNCSQGEVSNTLRPVSYTHLTLPTIYSV